MSEPIRYAFRLHEDDDAIYLGAKEQADGMWVKYEDYAELKAEVERLQDFNDGLMAMRLQDEKGNLLTASDYARLKAEVERLRFIGDEIIMDVYRSECLTDKWCKMARKWDAAKEGKQS